MEFMPWKRKAMRNFAMTGARALGTEESVPGNLSLRDSVCSVIGTSKWESSRGTQNQEGGRRVQQQDEYNIGAAFEPSKRS